ncbi:MAG: chemotaxis protein CheW [Calothrix sp. MO_192.B10]|nr:chemotaxis protein CheW [Calothrix sp. MO_192.B10]
METTQKFLIFNVGEKDKAVISLENVTEVMQVALNEICGVPQMPSCVLGIYNWRGEMLWLVDLESMLGYESLPQESHMVTKMMTIVVQNKGKNLGFLVRQLMDIEGIETQDIKPPSHELFSPAISPFLHGYFINDAEEMIMSLDAEAIIQASMWSIHS